MERMGYGAVQPDYEKRFFWEAYYKQLDIEYRQCLDEGKDIEPYRELFEAAARMPNDRHKAEIADALYALVQDLPQRKGYPCDEPSGLEAIRAACEGGERLKLPGAEELADRIKGAWYGRICGCLLGKPFEGMMRGEIRSFLGETGNLPLSRYAVKSDARKISGNYKFPIAQRLYADGPLPGMPVDDDTNYIVIAEKAVRERGRAFTPDDMMDVWIESQTKQEYCTAERVAYRNFVDGFRPPHSAAYKNPYREWIGAQIRGDYFGWICPGDPEQASGMAFRDACISHVKNGIYGEMWVSAMLAYAACGNGAEEAIRGGMRWIPKKSRLYGALEGVLKAYRRGTGAEEFFRDFHSRWNDSDPHEWCHTVSNAEIVAAALLWSGNEYGKAVCLAAQQGFDTDCNAATAGSVMGMLLGAHAIGAQWKDKVSGTLFTGIRGRERVSIDEMADLTVRAALG